MKIAILSDTHDNIWKLDDALGMMGEAEALIHCGDLCSPFVIKHLGKGLAGGLFTLCGGNNDGDQFLISRVAAGYPSVKLHGQFAELTLDGVRIAVNHYPEIARLLRPGDGSTWSATAMITQPTWKR
jgi:uncharacterized protein